MSAAPKPIIGVLAVINNTSLDWLYTNQFLHVITFYNTVVVVMVSSSAKLLSYIMFTLLLRNVITTH